MIVIFVHKFLLTFWQNWKFYCKLNIEIWVTDVFHSLFVYIAKVEDLSASQALARKVPGGCDYDLQPPKM